MLKKTLAVTLCVLLSTAGLTADDGYRVDYDGGSVAGLKPGSDLKMYIETESVRLAKGKKNAVTIPVGSITEISYGQDVHRRVGAAIGLAVVSFGIGGLMALTKSKKHYIGITWDDGSGNRGGLAVQADKGDYRGMLAGLEGVSGKKAVNSDTMTVKN